MGFIFGWSWQSMKRDDMTGCGKKSSENGSWAEELSGLSVED